MPEAVNFEKIDLRSASEHEYKCLGAFRNITDQEAFPDDPLMPLEEQIKNWKNMPALIERHAYIGWHPTRTEVIAFGAVFIRHTGDNEHIADFRIDIHPEFRCQGLGRQMLEILLPIAQDHQRSLLMTWTLDRVPAAAIFMQRMGARRGLEGRVNQLKIAELDRALIERWFEQSVHLAGEFELGLWVGAFPEDHIVEVADLLEKLANDQPRDTLEMEDEKYTPDFIRQIQKNMLAVGVEMWTLYVVDRANQKLVGWTEVSWHPNRPRILNQGFTAVDDAYRNKGLGRWLKAAMMKKVLQDRPQVEFIRTRNANSNAPMLKINNEMGFKPYCSLTAWQVKIEQVENYLNERNR